MEKQKQIEEIKDWIDSIYGCDCAYYGVDGLMIAEGLYNAGYRKQEWISVEERLPETSGSYIVCTNKGSVITAHYYADAKRFSAPFGKNVVYWMPLPIAPKGDG